MSFSNSVSYLYFIYGNILNIENYLLDDEWYNTAYESSKEFSDNVRDEIPNGPLTEQLLSIKLSRTEIVRRVEELNNWNFVLSEYSSHYETITKLKSALNLENSENILKKLLLDFAIVKSQLVLFIVSLYIIFYL